MHEQVTKAESATGIGANDGAVTAAEVRYAAGWASLLMAATCLPYLLCAFATPQGGVFPGSLFNADDHGVYFAWMRQGADGHLFFRNLFTSEPQLGRYVHLWFWALGGIAGVTGLPVPLVYHAGRVLAGIATLVLVYRLGAFFARDGFARRVIFWTTALSAGLGWLSWQETVSFRRPIDQWQPEAFTFHSLYTNGLFSVSLALMLGVVVGLLLAQLRGRSRYAVAAGACGFLLANIHTYDVITLAAVWAAYLVAIGVLAPKSLGPRLRDALVAVGVAAPAAAYQLWFYRAEAVFQQRVSVRTDSPPFGLTLLGYGLLLPLAAYGGWLLWRSRRPREAPHAALPVVWAMVGLVLPNLGLSFERKLIMGEHLPLALLAGIGVFGLNWLLFPPGTPAVRRAIAAVLIGLLAVSPVKFVLRDVQQALGPNLTSTSVHPVWWRGDHFAALHWFRAHSSPDAVLLAQPIFAVYAPATTGRRVYAGHWGETPDFEDKVPEVNAFYTGTHPDPAGFLKRTGATHVLFGPYERGLSESAKEGGRPGFSPLPGMREIYRVGEAVLYEVGR